MTADELLPGVKSMLGITGNYQNETVKGYINETLGYMKDAGVPDTVLNSADITGIVARGVLDLWNYGAGGASFSPYFFQRITQFAYRRPDRE